MTLIQSKIIRTILFVMLGAGALMQLKISLFEQSKYSKPRPHSTLWRQQISPRNLSAAARDAYLYRGQDEKALHLLQRALTLDPLYMPGWITLSELKLYRGDKPAARAILDYIDKRMLEVSRWRWQKTMLAYQLGDREILARDLGYAVAQMPKHRQQALDLAAGLWPAPEVRLEKIGRHNLLPLFHYSLRRERLSQALVYWPEARLLAELKLKDRLRFIELLRRYGDVQQAREIWRQELKTGAILYNGSFSTPPLQTAFGWRVATPAGTSWELVPKSGHENSAFHLHFNGTENVGYAHLTQYFTLSSDVVAGTACTLTGEAVCRGLTTDQRPYLEIAGVDGKGGRARTPMFAANQDSVPFSLSFNLPAGCRQLYVRLRRDKSHDINCLIAGDIRLSNLKITGNGLSND
jgi:hypothetical protein